MTHSSFLLLAALALANGLLLTPAGSPFRVAGGLILLLLPGLAWARRLFPTTDSLARWTIGAGLSYMLAMVLGLILHYLPGPILLWAELATLNVLTLIALLGARGWGLGAEGCPPRLRRAGRGKLEAGRWSLGARGWALIFILLLAACFRFTSLGYSEFQGDEALAMISAAETLEGHQDALFLRGKGPGEVLLPMVLWRLTGTINEPIARLPFATAGLLMVLTTYLLGRKLGGERAGLVAAGLLALNGFMVGFSRIVQYQTFVVWMSALVLLCAWEWHADGRTRWAVLAGAFLGAGLLAHYDALLVAPALAYVQISNIKWQIPNQQAANQQASDLPTSPGPRGGPSWLACTCGAGTGAPAGQGARAGNFQLPPARVAARPGSPAPVAQAQARRRAREPGRATSNLQSLLAAGGTLLAVAGLFYLPYALDPQAVRTGGYLGDRIGSALLKNNLDSFLHFNVFYTSSYYLILTGLLVLGFLAWALGNIPGVRRIPGGRYVVPALAVVAALGLALKPDALHIPGLDLAALPFALILLGAFLSPALDLGQRAVVAWLAIPFLGYNFAVARPLTHIYTIVPAWTLLAGLAAAKISNIKYQISLACRQGQANHKSLPLTPYFLLLTTTALFSGYLYTAYLRHDVEFWQDWPASQPALYWSPYDQPPPIGFFGFAHRTGWKGIGALYADGQLSGDYGSNEEPDVTTWYTRGAPRACDAQPEYYYIADDLVDPWPVDLGVIQANYDAVGRVTLPSGKGLTIYQTRPSTSVLGPVETDALARAFDRTATPAAFARSARGGHPADVNVGNLVRLIGYDVDARRAWPGGRVAVTLYWRAQAPIPADYHVFVHLEGDGSATSPAGIWGQADSRPVCWTYPTFDWRPGQIIADQHAIIPKPDTPPGDYPILVGMYRPDTGARLDVLDEVGQPVANFIKLTTAPVR